MARENALFIPHCRQVHARIPAKDKRKISDEPAAQIGTQSSLACCGQQYVEPLSRVRGLVHAGTTESSIPSGRQTTAACTNAAKIPRENALCV
jgi:hypothetical protein